MTLTAPRSEAPAREAGVGAREVPLRRWYAVMLAGGVLGVVSAGWQVVERINWASDPNSLSVCELSSRVSCSTVFSHWQSSALGIPNGVIALPVFAFIAAAGLAGVMGALLSRRFLATVFGVTVFMTTFITWYMAETAYDIRVVCLFCTACMLNIVIAGVGITRVVAGERALGEGRSGRGLALLVSANADLLAWAGLVMVVAAMLFSGLVL